MGGDNVFSYNLGDVMKNVSGQIVGNKIKMTIPPEDIKQFILSRADEAAKKAIDLKVSERGIVIIYDISSIILNKIGITTSGITVNPSKIEITIPYEDIIRVFKDRFPNADVTWENGNVVITMDVNAVGAAGAGNVVR